MTKRPKSASVYNLGYDLEKAHRYHRVMELTGAPLPTFAASDLGPVP